MEINYCTWTREIEDAEREAREWIETYWEDLK